MTDKQFPQGAIHGQEFVDSFNVVWIFNGSIQSWIPQGKPSDLPAARSGNQCREETE